ncbi:MAG: hypothetical protein IJQ25_02185, partial [Oscillibacter sp.]|nr:hypothetical protein [Oscillibacter sp.]
AVYPTPARESPGWTGEGETPMDRHTLEELWRRKKSQTIRLMEVADLTRQILLAAEHRDQISVTMLLSMREEPVKRLEEVEASCRELVANLPEADAIRAAELLNGAPPESPDEIQLYEQVGQYRRLLESTVEMDRRLSIRMGGERSFYKKFRPRAPQS